MVRTLVDRSLLSVLDVPSVLDERTVVAQQHGRCGGSERLAAQDGQILVIDLLGIGFLGQQRLGLLDHGQDPRSTFVGPIRADAQTDLLGILVGREVPGQLEDLDGRRGADGGKAGHGCLLFQSLFVITGVDCYKEKSKKEIVKTALWTVM